jgi:hypothetical protein
MSLTTILSPIQTRIKDCFASSPAVGLTLRCNGEEVVQVIDARGNIYPAGFTPPSTVPTFVAGAASGTLVAGQYYGYVYSYASSKFPYVESDNAIGGSLAPSSLPGPAATYLVPVSGSITITVATTTATGVDTIWLFRTANFSDATSALTAAQAGQAYFVTSLQNSGSSQTYTDGNPVSSADQISTDNFTAPQFQFAVYYDPYWWGFGNLPFVAACTYTTSTITLTGSDTWFNGRNGQNVTLDGVTTGGIDGNGTFLFLWLTSTTAYVTLDGITPTTLPNTGAGNVTIQGPATSLYRSKPRNPFSWGWTQNINNVLVPQQYAFKIGGGMGTAIGIVPNNATLKLDCEYPATCYTLNLRAAGTDAFEGTLRIISSVYSVSSHFSQFSAVTQTGQVVLWGMDFKNFCIVQSDGMTQIAISTPVPRFLRGLTTDRTSQLLTHGCYDPKTELNCIWVRTAQSLSLVNYLLYQHAPTGFWGTVNEQDVLSSATLQDSLTGQNKTFVGTQTGLIGQTFVHGVWSNWLPDTGTYTGIATSATSTSITMSTAAFNTTDLGMVGNWVLVTDANGQQEQWARISAVTATTLTFDLIRAMIGGSTTQFNPVPAAGWQFYVGLIECRLLKYFDLNSPSTDKNLSEIWLTQEASDMGTLIRYYRERSNLYTQFTSLQDLYQDGTGSDAWFDNTQVPSELVKMFGLEFINRGYQQWRLVNATLKTTVAP